MFGKAVWLFCQFEGHVFAVQAKAKTGKGRASLDFFLLIVY